MALPTSYLTTVKNIDGFFNSLRNAKAPEKFTSRFLESLDFKSAADRLYIGVLKALGFLDDAGKPQDRYFRYLDQTQSSSVLAEAIEDAYADLFQINRSAHSMSKQELVNKIKTLTQGQLSESVLDKVAMTFMALVKLADFKSSRTEASSRGSNGNDSASAAAAAAAAAAAEALTPADLPRAQRHSLGGIHYNIQLILPDSRDPKVYDALFRSLREHLLA